MFGKFFDIDESAFSIAPNPKYLYLSKQHEEALAHLVYGVTRKSGFVCLTGDIGTGKTTICRCMFEQLPENTDIAFVVNPKVSSLELLATICEELKLGSSSFQQIGIKDYVNKIHEYLIKAHAQGRNTVLVIDEAQNLSVDALEHVRALTNLETNDQKLLQIILIGQPELKILLAKPELEQVNQRITARFHIGPLSLNETNHYINHRLLVAGAKTKIFSSENIKQIYKHTKGVPRRINILCDRILLGAFTARKNKISSQIIKQSSQEVFGVTPTYLNAMPKALAASVFVVLISGVAVFAFQNNSHDYPLAKKSLNAQSEKTHTLKEKSEVLEAMVNGKEPASAYVEKAQNKQDSMLRVKSNVRSDTEKDINASAQRIANKTSVATSAGLVAEKVENTKAESKQELQFTSYGKAYQQLFGLWGISYSSSDATPCEHAMKNLLRCYQARGNINKVIGLNRPVLLKSKNAELDHSYIVVVSIEGNHAVINEKGDYQSVTISEIEENWSGEFELLWRPLNADVTNIFPGQTGQAIALLDERLAKLQGRKSSVPNPFVYSKYLVDQVKAFQLANNLPPDGVVGPITQIYFNNSDNQLGELEVPFLTK